MNVDIKSIHFELDDEQKDFFEKKIHKVEYAKDLIVDLVATFTKEKSLFILDININFKRNNTAHIKVKNYDLIKGIDEIIDKLERNVRKEKEKIKSHQ